MIRLWWGVGGLITMVAVLVGQSILTSRHQHEEQAVVETYSVARVLESDVSGLVDKVSLALLTTAAEREHQLVRHHAGAASAIRDYAAAIQASVPDVPVIRFADAEGRVTQQTGFADSPPPRIDRLAHFARLRDRHESSIVISAPHRDESLGTTVIDLARRVEAADGTFAGAVVASMPVDRLVRMLAAAETGSNGEVTLRGEGLVLVARYPQPPREGVPDLAPEALRDLVAAGEISGTFHARSSIDAVERLYSYRRVDSYPLYVTVGRARGEYLGHWRRDMGVVSALAAVLVAVTVIATAMIDRAWRRQRHVTRLLEMQAHTDALTGLANRRRFFEMAEAELTRTRRYAAPLALLMLDIDHFKEVNDTHGHRTGDRILRQLALTCLEVLRTVDVVGRVGGEEFAILLPETGLEGAVEVAERLREAVQAVDDVHDDGVPVRITVSIGVAALEAHATLDVLMSRADDALYEAKRGGRNRVCAGAAPAMAAAERPPSRIAPSPVAGGK